MLRGLDIRDLLIIDRLELDFRPGLNVLTGETGAGKSILLDSLGFVLGWRGRADLVREGADQGEVTAWFDLPEGHPAHQVLEDAGLPGGAELILRRVNARDGRKTAWINDRRASGEVLRRLSDTLVELHGQHDDRGLLNASGHRAILDAFGELAALKQEVRDAWRARTAAEKQLDAARAALQRAGEEEEFLRHSMTELDKLAPLPGEEAELDAKRRMMQGAERVREDISRALQALGNDGAEGAMGDASRWLDGAAEGTSGQLDAPIAALVRAMNELGEAVDGVERCLEALDFDPFELEATEERLFALRGLARKHGVLADELATLASDMRTRLDAIDSGEAQIEELERAARQADAAYAEVAGRLTAARRTSALQLDMAVEAELAPLKMERARFTTLVDPAEPGPEGRDEVSFTVATNPGAPSGPLAKIASGGELSRFLLALKVCLTRDASSMTMIFDEIDRGVGGATADAVGRRLADLAGQGQVLVVTHSPQVAARGAHHWQVSKRVEGGKTLSTVRSLSMDQRVDELARMISGDAITEEARAAARRLITAE
ncbi:DNA repair protein RecN [Pseudooceanicola sp. CBS1P-1]|uniref:DNA repair protein RecN n=1 Tax=Pseudooceanicola albus TaxID=2692189 RepID=A0A6L7G0Z2_9RHOB|nr:MULTISPECIES: DNA repair protein RecN [Pseudooceanicola]MBT9382575.1 DNA repair protein RecN [Pseudooceanicola endophyticus]MXN17116.1 DNA repair protein RecN [Pseudooceanicola albus]